MVGEVDAMTGLEFELGNGKSFTFGLNDDYKESLMEANARLDEYLIPTFEGTVAGTLTCSLHTGPSLTASTVLSRLHTGKA